MGNAYEWNGRFYSASGWQQYLQSLQEQQRASVARAIVAANPALNYDEVYNNLTYVRTKGGNADYSYNGDFADLSFIPTDSPEGGAFARYGIAPSLHLDDGLIHQDTVNGAWAIPLGSLAHFFADVVFGNINGSVPIVH